MTQLWCNGQWLDSHRFTASPTDRGMMLGLGLFETFLTYEGHVVFADRHLSRLRLACAKLAWDFSLPDFGKTANELLVRNNLAVGRARIRLAITAGSGPLNDLTPGGDRVVCITAHPVGIPADSLTACFSPWPRNERSPLAGMKSASYAENLIALDHARRQGFDEVIFFNTIGHLCEASTANLFLVSHGALLTPPLASGCLPGITREVVIELANVLEIPCEERNLLPGDLGHAEEIFLTSSIRGVARLSRFGEHRYDSDHTTQVLQRAFQEAVANDVNSRNST